jgi:hypothetical protein
MTTKEEDGPWMKAERCAVCNQLVWVKADHQDAVVCTGCRQEGTK